MVGERGVVCTPGWQETTRQLLLCALTHNQVRGRWVRTLQLNWLLSPVSWGQLLCVRVCVGCRRG